MDVFGKLSVLCILVGISLYYNCCTDKPIPKYTEGFTAPGWQKVADTFRKQIESGWQEGGAFSVYYKGKLVVEAFGGYADDHIYQEWTKDTISQYFSTTKAVGAIVMAMLVDRGLLDYKKPVSKYWPEFAQNGKEDITVEQLLSHQAGVATIDEPFDYTDVLFNDQKISKIFASQKPAWKIGEGAGYHAITIGVYEDQLVKRVDPKKRTLSQFFQDEVAKPLNMDFFIGLPKEENYRCARNTYSKYHSLEDFITTFLFETVVWMNKGEGTLLNKLMKNPPYTAHMDLLDRHYNKPVWRQIPCAATQGFGTTTALAKLLGVLANGGKSGNIKILSKNVIKQLQEPLTADLGLDLVLKGNFTFGRGVSIWKSTLGSHVFGAPGAGGQMGRCDPDNNLAMAYLTNHMGYTPNDPKFVQLEEAVYRTIQEL